MKFFDKIQDVLIQARENNELERDIVDSFEEWLELIKNSLEPNYDIQKLRSSYEYFKSLV